MVVHKQPAESRVMTILSGFCLARRFTRCISVPTANLLPAKLAAALEGVESRFRDARADRFDGLRLEWPDRWLIVRGSNTEPIVRVISEAPTVTEAEELARAACEIIGRV